MMQITAERLKLKEGDIVFVEYDNCLSHMDFSGLIVFFYEWK